MNIDQVHVFLTAPRGTPTADLVELAVVAERLGYGAVWVGEAVAADPFTVLGAVAMRTERIALGTGVAHVYARTPAALWQGATTVGALAGGRQVNLGVGSSTRVLAEQLHETPYRGSTDRLRRSLERLRQLRSGEIGPLLQHQVPDVSPRVYAAALGPRALRLTGELADGWLPIWPSQRHFPRLHRTVVTAAEAAGRDRPRVAAYLYAAAGEEDQTRQALRRTLAHVMATHGRGYLNLFAGYGLADLTSTVRARWAAGDRGAAAAAIPDAVLDDLAAPGEPSQVAATLIRYHQLGVDHPVLRPVDTLPVHQQLPLLEAVAAALRPTPPAAAPPSTNRFANGTMQP